LSKSESRIYCPDGDGFYVNYDSKCKEYHVCLFTDTEFANAQFLSCPPGLAFDKDLKACNFKEMVKCKKTKSFNQPTNSHSNKYPCKADRFFLIENSNCEKYYLCAFSYDFIHLLI